MVVGRVKATDLLEHDQREAKRAPEDSLIQRRVERARSVAGTAAYYLGQHLLDTVGDVRAARTFLLEALELRSQARRDAFGLLHTLDAVGALELKDGNPRQADERFTEALNVLSSLPQNDHTALVEPRLLSQHAQALVTLNRLDEAEQTLRRALEIALEAASQTNIVAAQIAMSLGELLWTRGAENEAEVHFRQGMAMLGRTVENRHPDWANAATALLILQWERG